MNYLQSFKLNNATCYMYKLNSCLVAESLSGMQSEQIHSLNPVIIVLIQAFS
jgi:hypothetical protein